MNKLIIILIMNKLIFVLILSMCSCRSAQWHLRKAVKLDPNIIKTDVIIRHDTVKIIEYDSVFIVKNLRDSILIGDTILVELRNKDLPAPIKVRLAIPNDSSMFLAVDCPDIVNTTTTTTNTYTIKPTFWQKVWWAFIGFIFALVIYIISRSVRIIN